MQEYAIIDCGTVKILQAIKCSHCNSVGQAYVDMSYVIEDRIPLEPCPICSFKELEIITYKDIE